MSSNPNKNKPREWGDVESLGAAENAESGALEAGIIEPAGLEPRDRLSKRCCDCCVVYELKAVYGELAPKARDERLAVGEAVLHEQQQCLLLVKGRKRPKQLLVLSYGARRKGLVPLERRIPLGELLYTIKQLWRCAPVPALKEQRHRPGGSGVLALEGDALVQTRGRRKGSLR